MSNEKMTSFSVVRKKTPFQKHREEEEAKKKRADEEAARLYEEFVESFKADDLPGGKAFVRGGTINPNERVKHPQGHPPHPPGLPVPPSSEGPIVREKDASAAKKPGSRYVPSFMPPGLAAMVNKEKDPDKRVQREEDKNKDRDRGKSRNIDHFMEELKREQEAREKRTQDREHRRDGRTTRITGSITADTAADNPPTRFDELPEDLDPNGKLPGSFDDGDPQTTNLYVGNLSPQVDENFLLRTFGRFGPIASVKIMWPRTEEERRRQRNCGFVAFMNRGEAQAAKDEMQGIIVYEYELRIGWGKAVALPAQALPAPPPGQMAVRAKEGATAINVAWSGPGAPPAPAAAGQNAEVIFGYESAETITTSNGREKDGVGGLYDGWARTGERVVTPNVPDIQVIPPEDEHLRHIIDTMAMYVLDDGCAFEQAIMERGRGNALFSFLFDLGSTEHTYYLWRLYSFAQGDTLQRWRTEPFIMITGSGRWIPPALPLQEFNKSPEREKASGTTFAAGRGRRTDLERALTEGQRDEFEDMLRALTLERSQIREAMGFALDNSEAAGEVVEVLTESLTLLETPIPTKVARLMLVSDVLHNSSAPVKNASAYRTGFESRLPDIMESFNDLYRNITGRITAEALKERVMKVLQVWADWFLFSDAYVNGLRATFLRPGNSGVAPFHTLVGDILPGKENGGGTDGEPGNFTIEGSDTGQDAALAMGEGAAARELASLPLAELERRCRHNGLSIRGGREVMVARLLSLEEAEKQKNHEPEEDLKVGPGYGVPAKGVVPKDGEGGVFRMRGEGRWSSTGGWTEVGSGWKEMTRDESDKIDNGENGDGLRDGKRPGVRWPQYEDEEVDSSFEASRDVKAGLASSRAALLPPTLVLPQPELKVFVMKVEKADPVLPASKWTREDNASDEDEKGKGKGLGLGYSSSGSDEMFGSSAKVDKQDSRVDSIVGTANDTSMDEERRQKLRKLEVAVMEYRESLEERGIKSSDEIEQKVSFHRKKLEVDFGLSEGPSLSGRDRDSKGETGSERNSTWSSERGSLERKEKRDEKRESGFSKKRTRSGSRSRSPSRLKDRSNREKDRDRDKEKERDREKDRDRERDREREREKERGRDREEKDREKVGSSRDREEHDKERDRIRDRERDRDRDKERERERDRDKRSRRSEFA